MKIAIRTAHALLLALVIPGFGLLPQARGELKTDVEFAKAGGVSLTLDAFVPEGEGPFPTAILVHGGGFVRGNKQTYIKPLFEPLSKAGFTWFTINYRLAPDYKFPAQAEDVEAAIKWVRAHAKEYKVDLKRIALIGESAGGHLVSYVGTDNTPELGLAAVIPFYAPHDLETRARESGKISASMTALLGLTELNEDSLRKLHDASPISHVKKGLPPFLLIHGTKDAQVPYDQSVKFQEKMKAAGNTCELFTIPDGGHGMGGWDKAHPEYKDKVVSWLKATMRVGESTKH